MLAVLLIISLFFLPTKVHSQVPTVNPLVLESQSAYILNRNAYQMSLVDYNEKSQVYLKYNTITTKNDKFFSLKQVLIDRNKMLSAYTAALRIRLDTYRSINFETTSQIQESLLNLEKWLNDQNVIITAINSEADLQTWISVFTEKYTEIQKIVYMALIIDEDNRDLIALNKINETITYIQTKPNISESDNRLFNQIHDQSTNVSISLKNSYDITQKENISRKFDSVYLDALDELNNAYSTLSEMNGSLKLLVTKLNGQLR